MIKDIDIAELREIANKSTKVVGWYPHSQYDGYHLGRASVRGPFGRWLMVEGGDNGMGDPVNCPTPVADLFDDAKFAAAAMNNLVPLLNRVESLEGSNNMLIQEAVAKFCTASPEYLAMEDKVRAATEVLEFSEMVINHALMLDYLGEGSTKGMAEDAVSKIEVVLAKIRGDE